jgi:hypothetical protein
LSEAQKIRDKNEKVMLSEIAELQGTCPHREISDWAEEWWAPGHATGHRIKYCLRCDKIMEVHKTDNDQRADSFDGIDREKEVEPK